MTVDSIKQAISALSEEERGSLAAWIVEQDYDEWDKEMMRDFSPGGRGEHVVKAVEREIRDGKFTRFEERLRTDRNQS